MPPNVLCRPIHLGGVRYEHFCYHAQADLGIQLLTVSPLFSVSD